MMYKDTTPILQYIHLTDKGNNRPCLLQVVDNLDGRGGHI